MEDFLIDVCVGNNGVNKKKVNSNFFVGSHRNQRLIIFHTKMLKYRIFFSIQNKYYYLMERSTDNPLSNRGAMAVCCRVFFLSGAEETVKLGLCSLYSGADPQRAK